MASPQKKQKFQEREHVTIDGYIHNVTDIKISSNNSKFFNFSLQTSRDSFHRGVVFAPEKNYDFKQAAANKTCLKLNHVSKILSK